MSLRLVMMGTGEFALPTFLSLCESDHQVVGLFTQPDRTGRGHHHHVNLLKEAAVSRDIPVFQPEKINTPEAIGDLRSLDADLSVVAAYGQILSADVLGAPRLGAINVHASLLPKYRGAAPIQYAILKGETETGVTIFQIEPKLDAGPILAVAKTSISPKETAGDLEVRLAHISVELVSDVLEQFDAGTVRALPQNAGDVTRAPRIPKSLGQIDWTKSAKEIDWHIRAMQPWPMAFTSLDLGDGKTIRLIVIDVEPAKTTGSAEPGTIISTDDGRLIVQTGEGALDVVTLRPEGKRSMQAAEFARGHTLRPGMRFLPA